MIYQSKSATPERFRGVIYNRNWLSYQLMKKTFPIWRIFFAKFEQHRIIRNVSKELNTMKNGYKAESHFFRVALMIEFFALALIAFIVSVVIVLTTIVTGEEIIHPLYVLYIGCIPWSLMFIHTWKSFNIEIIKARKIPYRQKSGYFTEVRNSDLVWPASVLFIVVVSSFSTYWG